MKAVDLVQIPPEGDHGGDHGVPPLRDGLLGLIEQRHLVRVVGHSLFQGQDPLEKRRLSGIEGFQERLLAAEEKAAHAGLHVHGRRFDLLGPLDHPVGVVHPMAALQQGVDADEGDRAEGHHQDQGNAVSQKNFGP